MKELGYFVRNIAIKERLNKAHNPVLRKRNKC